MAKRKISKKKVSIFIIIILIITAIISTIFILNTNKKEDKTIKIKNVDTIEGYDYNLSSNATKYYKELFKELKEVLEADEVDQDKYAKLITKLFVADFYNLDNKISKNDIGGVQFIYQNFKEDFEKIATTTIYKNVQSNVYNDRKQDLPIVEKVSVQPNQNETFKYGENQDENAYKINFEIEYKEDLGYQTEGLITIIHNDKKLEIAALEEKEN